MVWTPEHTGLLLDHVAEAGLITVAKQLVVDGREVYETQTAPDETSEAEQSASLGEKPQVSCLTRCAPGRIRTCDTRFRRAVLYPLSYEGRGLWEALSRTQWVGLDPA